MVINLADFKHVRHWKLGNSILNNKTFLLLFLFVAVGIINYLIGANNIDFSVSSIYITAIIIISWKFNKITALLFTFIATLMEYGFYLSFNSENKEAFLCLAVNMSMYVFICLIICRFKKKFVKEKNFSRHDYLTGIANRCYFMEVAKREVAKCSRYNRPISLAYFDCDNFKYVNDHYGHKIGDKLLRTVANIMKTNTRSTDLVARLSGDEFVILLPETESEQSLKVINKIRDNLLKIMKSEKLPVTFSIGIATFLQAPCSVNEMLAKSDKLMYEVKTTSKNAVNQKVFNMPYHTTHSFVGKRTIG